MKLGIDLGHIAEGETGGLVPYLQGLLGALFSDCPHHEVVVFGTPANENLCPKLPAHVQRLTLDADNYYPLLDVCAAALRLDVLFCSYPSEAEFAFPAARRIVLIPDLQHEFFPDFFEAEALRGRRAAFDKVFRGVGAIATLSEHAKQTLLSHPDVHDADVFVSSPALRYRGQQPSLEDLTEEERALLPVGDFFVYPANLWPHKNHRRVLEAFERFLRDSPRPIEFIFTGHPEGWATLRQDFPDLPIRHLGFVRHNFLQVLLARARALVFFSLFEGFGMPLLEAFAAGTPVACSNTTSLPEVGGDAVLACAPTDAAAMSACLKRVCADEDLRSRLVTRGRERLAIYDWSRAAACLVDACERVRERAAGDAPAALLSVRRVVRIVQEIQADRAARLDVIRDLDAHLRAFAAERDVYLHELAARLQVINNIDAALREANSALRAADEDRHALRTTVQHLEAALRVSTIRRCLNGCKRILLRASSPLG